ncbi:MAG: hypothetical protein KDD41_04625 [Flavobacteriales bacterium]|nr:hypothetical protein [Flavobacteriales bacterium]
MNFDPFDLVGTWKLTSENSEELLSFKPNGTYRIYYEVPFRLIELGEWIINRDRLEMMCCNARVSCKINHLSPYQLEFIHLSESEAIIKDHYIRINN